MNLVNKKSKEAVLDNVVDNVDMLHEEITLLKTELVRTTAFLEMLAYQMKIPNEPQTYTHVQSFESNVWTFYASFYSDVTVDVFVRTSQYNQFRKVNPCFTNNSGNVEITFDCPQQGYAVIKPAFEWSSVAMEIPSYNRYIPPPEYEIYWGSCGEIEPTLPTKETNPCGVVMVGEPKECHFPYDTEEENTEKSLHKHHDRIMKGLMG